MKKKISLFILLGLITSRIFAGEYVYWEGYKDFGRVSVQAKVCYPKGYSDYTAANEELQALQSFGQAALAAAIERSVTVTVLITGVYLSNNQFYLIMLADCSDGSQDVMVMKLKKGIGGEKIYDYGPCYSYNYAYNIYQTKCNKYLNML